MERIEQMPKFRQVVEFQKSKKEFKKKNERSKTKQNKKRTDRSF